MGQLALAGGKIVASGSSVWLADIPRPLGLNLASANYFNTQLPFLNVIKQAANNLSDGVGGIWNTVNGGTETNEEQYLQLDSDGYVTSLTASPVPGGGQQFTAVKGFTLVNVALGNGASFTYPPDTYIFMWQGKSSITFGGDVKVLANASAGCTISGLQVASTNAWGTTNSVTLQGTGGTALSPSSGGITWTVTAIPDSANYPKAFACVQSTYLSNYNGGQVFHPTFLAWLQKWPLASLRFMKPQQTENEVIGGPGNWQFACTFSANPASGNTSAVLSSTTPIRPGTRTITLQNGQTLSATFTAGSTTVNFGTAVSSNCTSAYFYLHQTTGFSDRSQVSNASYFMGKGWPLEVCCELANALNVNPWICISLLWSSADWASASGIILSTLNSNLLAYIEGDNEVWNGQYAIFHLAADVAVGVVGTGATSNEWYGSQVALMADQFATTFGNPGFDNRIAVQMGGQAANSGVITAALTTPHWIGNTPPWQRTSASGQKTIKGVAIAPYWGAGAFSTADFSHLQAQGDGGYSDFFAQLTANPVGGYSYSEGTGGALPAGGWFGQNATWVSANVTAVLTLGAPKINFYECGYQFGNSAGQESFFITACRDARMQVTFYTFFNQMVTAGCNGVLTLFDFCEAYGIDQWGTIESVMQTIASPPPRMLGAIEWGSGA